MKHRRDPAGGSSSPGPGSLAEILRLSKNVSRLLVLESSSVHMYSLLDSLRLKCFVIIFPADVRTFLVTERSDPTALCCNRRVSLWAECSGSFSKVSSLVPLDQNQGFNSVLNSSPLIYE